MRRAYLVTLLSVIVWMGGCVTPADYGAFLRHMPTSVLVLPPLNQSAEAMAADAFLSTVTMPLAESGFYVLPVALVDRIMRENGLPTPGEMHQVPLSKLEEVFGADAVLYVTITEWTQQYIVVSSRTSVTLEYRLVDLQSGAMLWQTVQRASAGRGGLSIQGLIEAAAHALISAASDEARDLAAQANVMAFGNPHHGLLKGQRHPKFEEDQIERREQQEKIDQAQ